MKRSEMLSKLEQIFSIPRFPRDKKLTADLVLKEIEKFNKKDTLDKCINKAKKELK